MSERLWPLSIRRQPCNTVGAYGWRTRLTRWRWSGWSFLVPCSLRGDNHSLTLLLKPFGTQPPIRRLLVEGLAPLKDRPRIGSVGALQTKPYQSCDEAKTSLPPVGAGVKSSQTERAGLGPELYQCQGAAGHPRCSRMHGNSEPQLLCDSSANALRVAEHETEWSTTT
jgi:hypothetical protein